MFWEAIKKYSGVWLYVIGGLSAFFGSIPLLSVMKDGIRFDFRGLPLKVITKYEEMRGAFFKDIADILYLIFTEMPAWGADIIVIYIVLSFVFYRGNVLIRKVDREVYKKNPELFREQLKQAALLNGIDPENIIRRFEGGVSKGFSSDLKFQCRSIRSAIRWPVVMFRNIRQIRKGREKGGELAIGLLTVWGFVFASTIAGCLFYILLSIISQA